MGTQHMHSSVMSRRMGTCMVRFAMVCHWIRLTADDFMSSLLHLCVFLACLKSPRPSSRFWQFLLLYCIIVILMKYIFQFPLFCICRSNHGAYYHTCSNFDTIKGEDCNTAQSEHYDTPQIIGLIKYRDRSNDSNGGDALSFFAGDIW
jgi:hypothetical protein